MDNSPDGIIVLNSPAGIIVFLVVILSIIAISLMVIWLVRSRNKQEKETNAR
jgi:hypothetical protein